MGNIVEARHPSFLRTFYYWTLLLVTLVVLDDLTFGWIFWALAQIHPLISASAAFAIYWAMGYWIALRGLSPVPGKLASWFLARLQLEHKNPELQVREQMLKEKITSISTAIPMALLFGGVVTTLWLRRRGTVDDSGARSLAFWLCGLYALEFALIHGFGIGGSFFVARQ